TSMRTEAMDAVSTWAKPSVMDRVDGRYRGSIKRDADELRKQTAEVFTHLLTDRELTVRRSAAKAIGKLRIRQAVDQLAAGLKDREASMRIECLKALVALEAPQQEQAIKLALADREKSVRVAGLNLLENMAIPKSVMVELLTNVIATK